MNLEVSGKIYDIEYTFEAAHCRDCVQKAWGYFSGASMMKDVALTDLGDSETANRIMTLNNIIGSMADVPDMVITFLYAGLLENHGDEVKSERDARAIYKQFTKEHPEDDRSMETGMMDAIRQQMEDDGFFRRIGLQDVIDSMRGETETKPKKAPKAPQDHKKTSQK